MVRACQESIRITFSLPRSICNGRSQKANENKGTQIVEDSGGLKKINKLFKISSLGAFEDYNHANAITFLIPSFTFLGFLL
jgi:hypothetical protein